MPRPSSMASTENRGSGHPDSYLPAEARCSSPCRLNGVGRHRGLTHAAVVEADEAVALGEDGEPVVPHAVVGDAGMAEDDGLALARDFVLEFRAVDVGESALWRRGIGHGATPHLPGIFDVRIRGSDCVTSARLAGVYLQNPERVATVVAAHCRRGGRRDVWHRVGFFIQGQASAAEHAWRRDASRASRYVRLCCG